MSEMSGYCLMLRTAGCAEARLRSVLTAIFPRLVDVAGGLPGAQAAGGGD